MAWIYVLLAAIVEVFWVVGLKYSETYIQWIGTGIAIVFSFYFIIKASEKIPAGTVYAVFTGSGAVAIVLVDTFLFNAHFTMMQFICIGFIMTGVVGLKITTDATVDHVDQKGAR